MSAWNKFQERYPRADLSKFTHTDWDDAVFSNLIPNPNPNPV